MGHLFNKKIIVAIACIGKCTRIIGTKSGALVWNIPEDMSYFKKSTMGHPVIMGRTTFESIGNPLSNRTNILITRNSEYHAEGVFVIHSLEEAISKAQEKDSECIFIIGGAEIYTQLLSFVDELWLTLVDDSTFKKTGEYVTFPEYIHLFEEKPYWRSGIKTYKKINYEFVRLRRY